MDISEQVKELRELADDMEKYVGLRPKPNVLRNAADTIESLSAKLADMERPAEDNGGVVDGKKVIKEIEKEIDGVIVKDTYSKGKNAGLRKAKLLIEEQMNHKP